MRLIFVADEIPSELRRIVEFLNAQMDPAEVLAVEIRQFAGEGLKALVPRVFGQGVRADKKRPGGRREERQWDEPTFFGELEARRGRDEAAVAKRILEWAKVNMPRIWWGKGRQYGSFIPVFDHKGIAFELIAVWTNGYVQITFGYMQSRPAFDDKNKRLELMGRMNAIQGVDIPSDAIAKFPSIYLSQLTDDTALKQFLEALDWAAEQIRAS